MDKELNFAVPNQKVSQVIDLQGVAAFASLVELLATELGAQASTIQGALPDTPGPFQQLVGHIELTRQGISKKIVLTNCEGKPLNIELQCSLKDKNIAGSSKERENSPDKTKPYDVSCNITINKLVGNIVPQGRALARNLEDMFAILERMLAIGQNSKVLSMSPSANEIEAFELAEHGSLVKKIL